MYGTATNVAVGSTHVQQTATVPSRGDEAALLQAFSSLGADAMELVELRTALAADRANNDGVDPEEPGQEVSKWWSRWSLKTASTAGKIGIGAAGGLAAKALSAYFGLGG
jgi:hypothetical protein